MNFKTFLDEDFLLENDCSRELYHDFASKMPIIDYHNHLPPIQLARDHQFENISQAWLYGDHYKWRAMRTLGVDERFISGNSGDREKFQKWAETVPFTMRNPLFHWTHLELQRYFDIHDLLNGDSAVEIYEECNTQLQTKGHSTNGLLKRLNVELICTTDDPIDDLRFHRMHKNKPEGVSMIPAFRPDKAILIQSDTFVDYIRSLGEVVGYSITDFSKLLEALKRRIDYFHENGSRLCDHGLEQINFINWTENEVDSIFKKVLNGSDVTEDEKMKYSSALLYHLGCMYYEKGWAQQFHLGAQRNNNTRMMRTLGPDTGFDSIGDFKQSQGLAAFLNALDSEDKLTKTIIYNLNPADNELMASMIGNFNDGRLKGKVQFGAAWWFLDQKDGMEKQINALSNMGLLSCFVGMLTDSRSFLSFPRHEYFRRILCNLIGKDVANGELPYDIKWLGGIVEVICYHNAKNYFLFHK